MEENNNTPNNNTPPLPNTGSVLATWSVILGSLGLVGDCFCFPIFSIWELPAGLFFGLIGVFCACLAKQGKPFTQQAQLGLILSILSIVCGLVMSFFIIFIYDIMDTNTLLGEYLRQTFENTAQSLMPSAPTVK